MTAIIKAVKLEKTYRDEIETVALRGLDFSVEKGEFISIMGPSGSGKSTLLHILGFLDRLTGGDYLFEGKSMNDYSDEGLAMVRNKKMGFIFQAFNLLPRTSALENVKLPLLYSDVNESLWNDIALKALDSVGMSHRIDYEPAHLSGGEKQRIAIARALVNDPSVIFADEPTGNLDSKSGGQVMEILEKLHIEGRTVILVTHETYTAEYAHRLIKIKDGLIEVDQIVEQKHKHQNGFFK
ncbi:MAG: ABC transporter ATP-binding protein [Candidatus Azambacteria bacterium]|nr:ABC transporter ATP-binding protein [Candidatus Azambacteria bacterium]